MLKIKFANDIKNGKKRLAIFGAGRYGRVMFLVMQDMGIPVHTFLDNNPKNDGTEVIYGVKCSLPHGSHENMVCVIAVNDIYLNTICEQAIKLKFAEIIPCTNYQMEQLITKFDDEIWIKRLYAGLYNQEIDLVNPKSFIEKLNWLKLYCRKPEHTIMADKYASRKYVADTIGNKYLIPLIGGPWSSYDEINFEELPNQFVLKCTHDCGSVFICENKDSINHGLLRERFQRKLQANFFYLYREWQYKNIPPKIIAEKFIQEPTGGLRDYRFFCFHGEPKTVWVEYDRHKSNFFKSPPGYYFYAHNWKNTGFTTSYPAKEYEDISPPARLDEMMNIARELSKNLLHARVDLYNVGEDVFFSEITLHHYGGFVKFFPEEWNLRLGEWVDLSKV